MFARTRRLTLRPGWPEDSTALHAAMAHPAVATRLADCPRPYSPADAAALLAAERGAEEAVFLIFAHEGSEPQLVGGLALQPAGAGSATISFWVTPPAWNRGYATEAAAMALEIAASAFRHARVEATYPLDNAASRRVLDKLGFVEVRREAQLSPARGGLVDCAVLERRLG